MADASVDQLKLSAMLKPVAEATDKRSLGHQASCHSSTRGRILAAAPTTQARRRLGRSVAIPASAIRERPCNEGPKAWRLGARARHARSMHRHTRPRMLRRRVCSCSTRAGSPPLRGHGRALPTIEMNATRSNGNCHAARLCPVDPLAKRVAAATCPALIGVHTSAGAPFTGESLVRGKGKSESCQTLGRRQHSLACQRKR